MIVHMLEESISYSWSTCETQPILIFIENEGPVVNNDNRLAADGLATIRRRSN